MKWFEIKVKTTAEATEAISNYFFDMGSEGTVIEDPGDILYLANHIGNWDMISEDLLQPKEDAVIVKGYLLRDSLFETKISGLQTYIQTLSDHGLNPGKGAIEISEMDEQDWDALWKEQFKPMSIGKHLVVSPTWNETEDFGSKMVIFIDPGLSFGTGSHETTAMCMEMLETHIKSEHHVLDVGTGTGILSITAAKLGAARTIGIDIDETAVKIAKENAKINRCEDKISFKTGDLISQEEGFFDVIVANLFAELLVHMAKEASKILKKKGICIMSGILIEKEDMVIEAYKSFGFSLLQKKHQREWSCLVMAYEGSRHA